MDNATEFERAKAEIISLIESGKAAQADEAVSNFISGYPDSYDKGCALQQIAGKYQNTQQYDRAIDTAEYVMENWPQDDFAVWAGMTAVISQVCKEDITTAEQTTERIITDYANNPQLPAVLFVIADNYSWQNMYGKARYLYGLITDKYAGSEWSDKARLGTEAMEILELIRSKSYSTAKQRTDSLLTDFSSNEDLAKTLFRIGRDFCWQRQYPESKDAFDGLIERFPNNSLSQQARLWSAKAQVCALIRHTRPVSQGGSGQATDEQALAAIDELIKDFEEDAGLTEAVYWISKEYEWSKWTPDGESSYSARYDTPKKIYQRLVKEFGGTSYGQQADWDSKRMTYRTKILTLMEKGDWKETEAEIERMIAEFSGRSEISSELYRIAIWLEQHEQYEQARQIYERIITDYPESFDAGESVYDVIRLATENEDNENESAAIELLAEKIKNQVTQPHRRALALYVLSKGCSRQARACEKLNNDIVSAKKYSEKAKQLYGEVVSLTKDTAQTAEDYYRLAECYRELEKFTDAISCYKKIPKTWPGSSHEAQCLEGIGKCYEELAKAGLVNKKEADNEIEQAYKELAEKYPDRQGSTEITLSLGWSCFRQGKWEDGIKYFEKALAQFPQNNKPPNILYALGKMYEQKGENSKAVAVYKQLVASLGDENAEADRVKSIIAKLKDGK